jgi:hypothetical protein
VELRVINGITCTSMKTTARMPVGDDMHLITFMRAHMVATRCWQRPGGIHAYVQIWWPRGAGSYLHVAGDIYACKYGGHVGLVGSW